MRLYSPGYITISVFLVAIKVVFGMKMTIRKEEKDYHCGAKNGIR